MVIFPNQKLRISFAGNYAVHKSISSVDLSQYAVTLAPNAPAIYKSNGAGVFHEVFDAEARELC
jgi:hypothetical protein